MNKIDYLLVCLVEELSEVQKTITKSLRFGLLDSHPKYGYETNLEGIKDELNDVYAILQMLEEIDVFSNNDILQPDEEKIAKKKEKILKYIEYAKERGKFSDV